MTNKVKKADNIKEQMFSKEQFLKSKMFANELDMIEVVMQETKEMTTKQLKNAIEALKGGKIKW